MTTAGRSAPFGRVGSDQQGAGRASQRVPLVAQMVSVQPVAKELKSTNPTSTGRGAQEKKIALRKRIMSVE